MSLICTCEISAFSFCFIIFRFLSSKDTSNFVSVSHSLSATPVSALHKVSECNFEETKLPELIIDNMTSLLKFNISFTFDVASLMSWKSHVAFLVLSAQLSVTLVRKVSFCLISRFRPWSRANFAMPNVEMQTTVTHRARTQANGPLAYSTGVSKMMQLVWYFGFAYSPMGRTM